MPIQGRNLGSMRLSIRIERKLQRQDASGEPVFVWDLVGTPRAEKLQTPGHEVWSAAMRSGRVPTLFKIRHPRADYTVLPQMRLTCEGQLYDITSAFDPDGRRFDLIIACMQQVNEPIAP